MGDTKHRVSRTPLRLSVCDVRRCEATCCYDGAYLRDGEEAFLTELVARVPSLAAVLPETFIEDGHWRGEFLGRKTRTRPHDYRRKDYPAHFARTRCVFADGAGFCELEKFARARGQHPWTFKPAVCWMFPLEEDDGVPAAPPRDASADPYRSPDYPGYSPFTPCGGHDPAGRPWRRALQREVEYLAAAPALPLLGSPGHTVEELLAAGRDPAPDAGL